MRDPDVTYATLVVIVLNFPTSGRASAPITFQSYPGQTAVIDGTGVSSLRHILQREFLGTTSVQLSERKTIRCSLSDTR
jgi:hypothetical protein